METKQPRDYQQSWLYGYDDKYLTCRERHDWPALTPGKRPQRTKLVPQKDMKDGVYLIAQTCGNCGRERWRLTGPRGVGYSSAGDWHYRAPAGYSAPKGMGVPRRAYLDELYRRVFEQERQQGFSPW